MKHTIKLFFIFFFAWHITAHAQPLTIMIDPAGDAKHAGRQLGDSLERGITLQCAEQLQKALAKEYPAIRIALTRNPGETLQPLQNANFANRLHTDLYIRLQFYQETGVKPHIALYHCSFGDEFMTLSSHLTLHPYDHAHIVNQKTTAEYAHLMHDALKAHGKLFEIDGVYALPYKPLIGIQAPAITIEMSLKSNDDWRTYIQPIMDALLPVIKKMERS